MEELRKREIIEQYSEKLDKAQKENPETGYDDIYREFKSVCDSNGYVGELKEQMWQSVVKRVKITNRKA
ncbi:MAG: hypothetical protein K6C99_11355 [Lachnospiraceae bacterium]|nr:hypothetical protein [Lachnospiraceae bacterium]